MTVPSFVLAVQARDSAGARAALAPTFQGKANGRALDAEGQMRLLQAWWDGFPRASFAMEAVGGSGRYVITWSLFGVHDGPYAGIPGTGKTVGFSGFIVAVADATGITSLDWKWDPKVFTKAVLGPDDIGTLEVKDHFRADPSRRWQHGDGRHGQGQRKPKGKGRGKGNQPRTPGGTPATGESGPQPAAEAQTGQALAAGPGSGQAGAARPPGTPRPPGQGRRRRGRGKGKRDAADATGPEASAPQESADAVSGAPAEPAAAQPVPSPAAPTAPPPAPPAPDGT